MCLQGYMPGQLYKLDSCYGNQQQLEELIGKLKEAGIDPLADIVINHRQAGRTGRLVLQPQLLLASVITPVQ